MLIALILVITTGFYLLLFALARAARDPEELQQEEMRRAIDRALSGGEVQDETRQRKC